MLDLTVIIPTIGRPTLAATLASIPKGAVREVLVLHDGLPDVGLGVDHPDARVWYAPKANGIGHPQRNAGMRLARGRWLAFMDDDDIYTPRAFAHIKAHLTDEPVPHIFKMRFQHGHELWRTQEVRHGNVGTPMFVVPNLPGKLGEWPVRRSGDFDFIRDTCELQGSPVWCDELIALIRPHERG